jgi:hypothetical protein
MQYASERHFSGGDLSEVRFISAAVCEVEVQINFRHTRKIEESNCLLCHVCLSIHVEELGSHWRDFYDLLYLSMFQKSADKM